LAKVDTGAYTGALHCSRVEEKTLATGRRVLVADLLDPSHGDQFCPKVVFRKYARKRVKSSNGTSQIRYTVRVSLLLGDVSYRATITLTDRSAMRAPVLLGRRFLSRRFLVDVSKVFCLDNLNSSSTPDQP
jgi:hypothetical protein